MPRRHVAREDHFTWKPGDIHFVNMPASPVTTLHDEQHTILWSLEHVSNKASLDEVMLNVAHYMADHPQDVLVPEAVRRAEQRTEHST